MKLRIDTHYECLGIYNERYVPGGYQDPLELDKQLEMISKIKGITGIFTSYPPKLLPSDPEKLVKKLSNYNLAVSNVFSIPLWDNKIWKHGAYSTNEKNIRNKAIKDGEEKKLAIEGHTIHFDGFFDQARDKKKTKFLVPEEVDFGTGLNTINKSKGIEDLNKIMASIMKGRELLIVFFSLGPVNSPFAIPAVQLTDSSYVAHSENILYRPGYEEQSQRIGAT